MADIPKDDWIDFYEAVAGVRSNDWSKLAITASYFQDLWQETFFVSCRDLLFSCTFDILKLSLDVLNLALCHITGSSNNLERLKDQLVLRQGTRLVAKHVVQLRQVFVQVEVFDRAGDYVALIGVKHGHLNVVFQEVNVHELAHLETNSQIKRYKRVVEQEEATEWFHGLDFGRLGALKDVKVVMHVCICEQVVLVGKKDAKWQHQSDIEKEDLVDDLVDVRLLKAVLALIQYQFRVITCVEHKQIDALRVANVGSPRHKLLQV